MKNNLEKEIVSYEQGVALENLEFEIDYTFGKFYTKPKSKMFGVDEKGRHYPIKNYPKKLYTLGEHFVLNDINVIPAPLKQQVFRWFREKYDYHHTIKHNKKYVGIAYSSVVNFSIDEFNTYEEAENACIDKLIELAKQQDK